MSHYFISDSSLKRDLKRIHYNFNGCGFVFTTDSGVFSKDHIDPATDILLNNMPRIRGSLLDMGCGYGCIGIVLAKTYGLDSLTQADVNARALELAKMNCGANGVESRIVLSDCFDGIDGTYDTITVNPPIHAGKAVTYKMYENAAAHINEGGKLYVVTMKKHGAESTRAKLAEVFGDCETVYKKKGVYILSAAKNV